MSLERVYPVPLKILELFPMVVTKKSWSDEAKDR